MKPNQSSNIPPAHAVALVLAFTLCSIPLHGTAQSSEVKTLIWADGTRYVGGVENGKRAGKGTIYWQDGTRFVGRFENDLRNGPGTMILPDGTVYNGFFKDDKLIQAPAEPGDPDSGDITTATAELEQQVPPISAEITTMTDTVEQQLVSTIDLWAAAWSEQNIVQYLDNYASDFAVPGRQSRRGWEATRRSRLSRPGFIEVKISYEKFEMIEPNVAEVWFRQTYNSDVYRDVTDKALKLRKEGPYWRILEERTR
ncbi:MAG: hypothetical protein WD002_00155 [Pseudomonadales bacterium]